MYVIPQHFVKIKVFLECGKVLKKLQGLQWHFNNYKRITKLIPFLVFLEKKTFCF